MCVCVCGCIHAFIQSLCSNRIRLTQGQFMQILVGQEYMQNLITF